MTKFVIGIGSQRAGSTLLSRILEECTSIFTHPVKELHYYDTLFNVRNEQVLKTFSKWQLDRMANEGFQPQNKRQECLLRTNQMLYEKSVKEIEYIDLFRPCVMGNEYLCEVTPEYMILPEEGVKKMAEDIGRDAKIILLSRDPIDRFISAVKLLKNYGNKDYDATNFEADLREVMETMPEWMKQQKQLNDYEAALNRYQKYFDNVILLPYEKLFADPDWTIKQLSHFLEIEVDEQKYRGIISKRVNSIADTSEITEETRLMVRNQILDIVPTTKYATLKTRTSMGIDIKKTNSLLELLGVINLLVTKCLADEEGFNSIIQDGFREGNTWLIDIGNNHDAIVNTLIYDNRVDFYAKFQIILYIAIRLQNEEVLTTFIKGSIQKYSINDLDSLRKVVSCCSVHFQHTWANRFRLINGVKPFILSKYYRSAANSLVNNLATQHNKIVNDHFLIIISWVPADMFIGAHLKQLGSYSYGILEYLNKINRSGKIKILITYENSTPNLKNGIQTISDRSIDIINDALFKDAKSHKDKLEIVHSHPNQFDNVADWLTNISREIFEFSPSCILKWYGIYTSALFSEILFNHYPVIGIQFNKGNSIDRFADILLNQGNFSESLMEIDSRWRSHHIPLNVLPKHKNYVANDFNFDVSKKIMTSVLSGDRIISALKLLADDMQDDLCSILLNNSDLIWILVGVTDVEKLPHKIQKLIELKKVFTISFLEDVRSFYKFCDFYVHLPNMAGGGMGVAMAVEEDTPVVAYQGTDPCNFLYPEYIADDWSSFIEIINNCVDSIDFRNTMIANQKKWLHDHHDLEAVGKEVYQFINEAIDKSKERLNKIRC